MIRGRLSTDPTLQSRNLIPGASPPATISLETFHQWAVLNCFHPGGIQGTSKSSPLSLMTIEKLLNVMPLYLNYLLLLFLHRLPRVCQATLPPAAGTDKCWTHLVLAGDAYKGNYGVLGKSFFLLNWADLAASQLCRLLSDLSLTVSSP